jgi:hypothetical protein
MDQEKQLSPEEIQVLTGRFTSFCAALGAAMTKCAVWRLKNGDKKLNALEVMSFAGKFDEEHPIPENDPSFYRVSIEGAIGICPGVEYLTNWLLLPAMDEESLKKFEADIKELQAKVDAKEKANKEPEPAPEPPKPEPAPAEPKPEIPIVKAKFCPNCGTPYRNDTVKFCANCGTKRG